MFFATMLLTAVFFTAMFLALSIFSQVAFGFNQWNTIIVFIIGVAWISTYFVDSHISYLQLFSFQGDINI